MANINSKDLEERLSPWAVTLEDEETEHSSPSPLNEKLSQWGVKLQEEEEQPRHSPIENVSHSPASQSQKSVSPRVSPARSPVATKGDEEGETELKEKLSPWAVNFGDEGDEHAKNLVLKEKLTKRGTSVEFDYVTRKGLEERLVKWGIETQTFEHPEVFTVEQALPHLTNIEGMFAKNLFLRDKKRKLYLFCAPHDAVIRFNDLARPVGAAGGLRLADADVLEEKLGLKQGAVTIFGLVNDQFNDVQLILDRSLINGTYSKLLFHPMVNSATMSISPDGLREFLKHTGHEPVLIDIPDPTD